MVTDYGRITLADITAHVATFITTHSQNSQNSKILLDFIEQFLLY